MIQGHEERRLSTIVVSDVVGYSRLMAGDEPGTFAQLKAVEKEIVTPKITQHHGRIVKLTGDGALMEFGSVVDAVLFAADIQHAMEERNAEIPDDRQIRFRIGINVGEVIVSNDDIYGDGVNIAARLQQIAEPGSTYVSENVHAHAQGRVSLDFHDLGQKRIKNIPDPIHVFSVSLRPDSTQLSEPKGPRKRLISALGIGAVVLVLAGLAATIAWVRPWQASVEPADINRMAFPLPERPSLAVLPFVNVSGDAEQEYFADGMTDDLITDLSKVSGLFVIARNSVFTYKNRPVRVQQVAEELGVRYVLEGSVRRADGRVRINAQLTDATTGRHLWADRYDREYKDIFALQDEVTRHIVSALYVQLTEGEEAQLAARKTDSLEAYEFYLRGQKTVHSFSISYTEELNTALLMYQEAIKRDPTFARAYVGHALVSYHIWRVAYVVPTRSIIDALREAHNSILAALALDPGLPEAYSVLAQVLLADGRYDEAMAAAANAVRLDPNNADSHVVEALILTKSGHHEEALNSMAKAYRLNPKPPPHYDLYLGKIQFDNRDYAGAAESLEQGLRRQPRSSLILWYLVPTYAYLDRMNEAKAEVLSILGFVSHENLARLARIGLYRNEDDNTHFVEGFRRAGISALPYDLQTPDADAVDGESLDALLFGRAVTITNTRNFQQFLLDRTREGGLTVRGPFGSDFGTSRIDGNWICDLLQSRGNRASCGLVYRETGSPDRYLYVRDDGVFTFAVPTSVALQ